MSIASTIHPAWGRCDSYAQLLHGRNCMIILGQDLKTPVEFVICWQSPNVSFGGTLMGIHLANKHGIPVYNLAVVGSYEKLLSDIGMEIS